MDHHRQALSTIRAALHAQIVELENHSRAMTLPALHEAIDAIRITAREYGLLAIEDVAHCFERSIARNRQANANTLYFDQLKLAADCDDLISMAGREAMLAAISVRVAG